jgi:hypothetical protein
MTPPISVKSYLPFFLLILCLNLTAQPTGKFKEWGQVTLDELRMKECSYEKDAEALLLFDLADLYYDKNDDFFSDGDFSITTAYYQRFKVFTEEGTDQANFKLTYRPDEHDNIVDIKGAAYNLNVDGQIQKTILAAADIHITKLSSYETEVSFTIPGVKKGSVFEVAYNHNQRVNYTLPSWYFHSDVPSLTSELRVGFLDAIEYYVREQVTHNEFESTVQPFVSDINMPSENSMRYEKLPGKMITYTACNLPSVTDEPFMNSRVNYADHVSFQLMAFRKPLNTAANIISSWPRLNHYLLDNGLFGGNIAQGGIPRKTIKDLLKNTVNETGNEEVKAKAIFEFVRKNMSWNGMVGMLPRQDNNHAWKIKSGSSADINVLLINALRDEGFNVFPMLIGSREYGYLHTGYPILNQFKSVVALLEFGKNKRVILDATDKFLPYGMPDFDLLNNYGYIVRSESEWEWYRVLNEGRNSETVFIHARMDNNHIIHGGITATCNNYSQAYFRRMKALGNLDVINEQLKKKMPNITIEFSTDTVDESQEIFRQDIKFTAQPVMDNEENIYLSISSLYGESTSPFVSAQRKSAVDFGYKQKLTKVLQFELPDGYEIDSLFKPKGMITSDTSISFLFDAETMGGTVIIRQALDYKRSLYSAINYPDFYEFHQQYYKLIQEPVVLRKKK